MPNKCEQERRKCTNFHICCIWKFDVCYSVYKVKH